MSQTLFFSLTVLAGCLMGVMFGMGKGCCLSCQDIRLLLHPQPQAGNPLDLLVQGTWGSVA